MPKPYALQHSPARVRPNLRAFLDTFTGRLYNTRERPQQEEWLLPEVYINSSESFDASLKRFNKMVQQSGILAEARRREHYEPPSIRRKKKAAAKRRKSAKMSRGGY